MIGLKIKSSAIAEDFFVCEIALPNKIVWII